MSAAAQPHDRPAFHGSTSGKSASGAGRVLPSVDRFVQNPPLTDVVAGSPHAPQPPGFLWTKFGDNSIAPNGKRSYTRGVEATEAGAHP